MEQTQKTSETSFSFSFLSIPIFTLRFKTTGCGSGASSPMADTSKERIASLFEAFHSHAEACGVGRARLSDYLVFLKKFLSFHGQNPFCIESYDFRIHDRFMCFLTHDCALSPNTAGKHIKILKVFLKYCSERENIKLHKDTQGLKNMKHIIQKTHLSWAELESLAKLDLEGVEAEVRDAFLFASYTGLRFSDLDRLSPAHLEKDAGGCTVVRILQKKTGQAVTFSLNRYALGILAKYSGREIRRGGGDRLLPLPGNHRTNRVLKEICRKAGLDSPVETARFEKGEAFPLTLPKYRLITFHISRHTYAVQSLMKGMPIEVLQKQLGHRDIKDTLHYARVVDSSRYSSTIEVWERGGFRAAG